MRSSKIVKRIFMTLGLLILLLIAAAILIPVLFKDKLLVLAKKELNSQLNAMVEFKDIDISILRQFPKLSVGIEAIYITGKGVYEQDTLIAAERIDVALDLMKAINGNYDILGVKLVSPRIHALVNEQGAANWDIVKPDTTTATTTKEESQPFEMKLRKYAIENAYIEYRDAQSKMSAVLENFSHSGSGDFTSDAFTLSTHTTADGITFVYGGVPYLVHVKTLLDADIQIDNKTSKYTFNTEKIQLNGLRMSTKGFVQMPDTLHTLVDVQFSTPSNDFKDILSLVPGIYQNDFKDIKTTGKATLKGFVKGTSSATQIPAYEVNLLVENGSFQYPALPQKVSNIQIKLKASNPDGVTDHTVVNIEKGHVELGTEPFDFRMLLKTPVSNPWVDATLKGRLDLSKVQQFVQLEAGTKLTGIITADVAFKGNIAAATAGQYDKLYAAGTIGIANLLYASKDYPTGVAINNLLLTFNPKNVTVSGLKAQYMQSNFTADGSIDNLLGYYLHNEALSGTLNLAVDKVDVNKWMGTSSTTTASNTTAVPASTEPFIVPDNLNLTLHASAGTVIYDNLTLTNMKGTLAIRDQTVYLQDLVSNALEGTIKINGYYSTKTDKKNPDIQLAYQLQNLDIKKTFETFNTVQKMMPVAKYLSGKMNTQLTMKGKLGPDMAPMMNTLTGKGDLLLLQGVLSKFAPVEQLADKLKINQLKSISLKDIKTYFSFENGRVAVEPFQAKVGDIAMEVAGSHGFDQTLQYGVNMAVPRTMLGTQANAVVNNLIGQAANKGVNVQLGDKVNFAVKIGGTIDKPTITTDLKNVAGNVVDDIKKQVKEQVQKKVDSVKTVVKDTVNALKQKAMLEAQQRADQARQQAEEAKRKAEEEAKKRVEEEKKKATEEVKNKAKDKLKGLFK